MNPADVRLSKFLARVLRHSPESAGLTLDGAGWAELDRVAAAATHRRLASSKADVLRVIATNDKKRFGLSADGRKIRAVQGHSTSAVSLDLEPVDPPEQLFHGTAERNLAAIMEDGLRPGRRHHVHLSPDPGTALRVGRRHGPPVVLRVASGRMARDGGQFFLAENGVWLTRDVAPQYLERL